MVTVQRRYGSYSVLLVAVPRCACVPPCVPHGETAGRKRRWSGRLLFCCRVKTSWSTHARARANNIISVIYYAGFACACVCVYVCVCQMAFEFFFFSFLTSVRRLWTSQPVQPWNRWNETFLYRKKFNELTKKKRLLTFLRRYIIIIVKKIKLFSYTLSLQL